MSKVLLAITSDSKNMKSLDEMIAPFEEEGYHVHFFEDLGDIELITLPKLVDYIIEYEKNSIQHFVFLSDIKELVFAWYRCYNHLIDDFVYCINPQNQNGQFTLTTTYNDFCRKLASFDGASEETLIGKIYIKINLENYKYMSEFLLRNCIFQYFCNFSDFDFSQKPTKKIIKKHYQSGNKEYCFIQGTHQEEYIKLSNQNKEEFHVSNNVEFFKNSYFFVPYACFILLESKLIPLEEKKHLITFILDSVCKSEINTKLNIYNLICKYISLNTLALEVELLLLYNLFYFKIDIGLGKVILKKLFHSRISSEHLFPMLMTIVANIKEDEIGEYTDYYIDCQKLMDKIILDFINNIRILNKANSNHKKIAIFASQLLSSLHSPTAFIINYAKRLIDFYPYYQIKIFVSDAFTHSETDLLFPKNYKSLPSSIAKDKHDTLLAETNITIHYSDHFTPRRQRLQNDINAICDFNPELIFDLDGNSIAKDLLYTHFPILQCSLAGISFSKRSDIYISAREEFNLRPLFEKYGLAGRKYYKHQFAATFPEPTKTILREDLKIKDIDFVMITVGNRLISEINEAFVKIIETFASDKLNIKWLVVGTTELPLISDLYSEFINNNVIFIAAEADLAALYQACDVFLNPFRMGGGFSAGMAMKQSLPIVALAEKSDVEVYIGTENCVQTIDDYLNELNRIYNDKQYALTKGKIMKQRIEEKFSFKAAMDELVHFFELTKIEFQKRTLQ